MILGQLFIVFLFILLGFYVSNKRSLLVDRITIILLIATGIVMVLFPEISVIIANALGIGRGADLVLYIFVVTSLFVFIYIISEQNRLLIKFTDLIRTHAIKNARDLTQSKNNEDSK